MASTTNKRKASTQHDDDGGNVDDSNKSLKLTTVDDEDSEATEDEAEKHNNHNNNTHSNDDDNDDDDEHTKPKSKAKSKSQPKAPAKKKSTTKKAATSSTVSSSTASTAGSTEVLPKISPSDPASVTEASDIDVSEWIDYTLGEQKGVLFCYPTLVWRGNYMGRGLVRDGNNTTSHQDERGYNAVERWIVSMTQAKNPITKVNEGISRVVLKTPPTATPIAPPPSAAAATETKVTNITATVAPATITPAADNTTPPLSTAEENKNEEKETKAPAKVSKKAARAAAAPPVMGPIMSRKVSAWLPDVIRLRNDVIMGAYATSWPLTKILDIGGAPVKANFDQKTTTPSSSSSNNNNGEHKQSDSSSSDGTATAAAAGDDDSKKSSKKKKAAVRRGSKANKPEQLWEGWDADVETPPIPVHVHSGDCVDGHVRGPGKKEAYFFPPLGMAPWKFFSTGPVKSRLGLKSDTTREEFMKRLDRFGVDDSMYSLLNVFDVRPYEGWTIPARIIHSPGPYLTFEIQRAADDFNLCSWTMGSHVSDEKEREALKDQWMYRGVKREDFIDELLDWDKCTDAKFEEQYKRPIKILEKGKWGRRFQMFFDGFYGEGIELKAGKSYTVKSTDQPWAGVVWSGAGALNGIPIDGTRAQDGMAEFLVAHSHEVKIVCGPDAQLFIYIVYPLRDLSKNDGL